MNDRKKDKMKLAASPFAVNIGTVIQRHRENKGLSQENLGNDIGVNGPTISRYEHGELDISASKMAYIAYLLGFSLKEYTDIQTEEDRNKTWDQLMKEVIETGQKYKVKKRKKQTDPNKPKYDRTDENGKIIPTYPVRKAEKATIPAPLLTEQDSEWFNYYMTTAQAESKRILLLEAHSLMNLFKTQEIDSKDASSVLDSIAKLITSDRDKENDGRLKDYRRKCEALFNSKEH